MPRISIQRRKNIRKTKSKNISFFTAKGKECATNVDCIGISDTSCVKDYDYKLRCLCGDFRAPNNGFCSAKMKGSNTLFDFVFLRFHGLYN